MKIKILSTFVAGWSNYIDGEKIRFEKQFTAGEVYEVVSTRPEGIMVDGFFLFEKYLTNCLVEE